jgi:predicted metal-dependent peptidase
MKDKHSIQTDKGRRHGSTAAALHSKNYFGNTAILTDTSIMSFGEHKGKMMKDIPLPYLEYITKQVEKEGKSLYTGNAPDRVREYYRNKIKNQ